MKKIGIITIVDNNNYGNRLQNLAVVKVYKKLGYDCETLLLNQRKGNVKYIPRAVRMCINPIKLYFNWDKIHRKRYKNFKRFNRSNNINVRFLPFWSSRIKEKYDFFSVGSDQIWNSKVDYGYGTEFLEFADRDQRICFSPSFGTQEVVPAKVEQYKKGLLGFNYLSVREQSGADIINSLIQKRAEILIDPTMMLSKEEWSAIAKKPQGIDLSAPYILDYFLGGKNELVKQYMAQKCIDDGCTLLSLLDQTNENIFCTGPAEFLYLIQRAELIVTDSFHAVVFSILFGKRFLVFPRQGQAAMGNRIDTLFHLLHIDNSVNESRSGHIIDAGNLDIADIIEKEQTKVYEFLKLSMGSKEDINR